MIRGNRLLLFSLSMLLSATALTGCEFFTDNRPAPVSHFGTHVDSMYGTARVTEGDTLWQIAHRYNLPLRDLIDANNFHPPYLLRAGQRLKLPAPREHRVGGEDTLHSVARMYGASVTELVNLNKLKSPYRIQIGQVLRLPSRAAQENTARSTAIYADQTAPEGIAVPVPKVSSVEAEDLSNLPRTASQKEKIIKPQQTRPSDPVETVTLSSNPKFVWPVQGKVVSSYGPKSGQLYNDGINIAAPKGTPVKSASDGVIAYVGHDLASYGNLVLIRHGGGMVTAYAHMDRVIVTKGQSVKTGQPIGSIGSTGTVSDTQLHFEIRRGTKTINPKKYLG